MTIVLFFLVLILVVHSKATKVENVNKPALYAIDTALAWPIIVGLDMAGSAGLRAPTGTGLIIAITISLWPVMVVILCICGMVKYWKDKALGGLRWCLSALVLILLLGMIVIPNFLTAAASH